MRIHYSLVTGLFPELLDPRGVWCISENFFVDRVIFLFKSFWVLHFRCDAYCFRCYLLYPFFDVLTYRFQHSMKKRRSDPPVEELMVVSGIVLSRLHSPTFSANRAWFRLVVVFVWDFFDLNKRVLCFPNSNG